MFRILYWQFWLGISMAAFGQPGRKALRQAVLQLLGWVMFLTFLMIAIRPVISLLLLPLPDVAGYVTIHYNSGVPVPTVFFSGLAVFCLTVVFSDHPLKFANLLRRVCQALGVDLMNLAGMSHAQRAELAQSKLTSLADMFLQIDCQTHPYHPQRNSAQTLLENTFVPLRDFSLTTDTLMSLCERRAHRP